MKGPSSHGARGNACVGLNHEMRSLRRFKQYLKLEYLQSLLPAVESASPALPQPQEERSGQLLYAPAEAEAAQEAAEQPLPEVVAGRIKLVWRRAGCRLCCWALNFRLR